MSVCACYLKITVYLPRMNYTKMRRQLPSCSGTRGLSSHNQQGKYLSGQIKSLSICSTRRSMDVDTDTSHGEQVADHYLSGAVTNHEKNYIELGKFEEDST